MQSDHEIFRLRDEVAALEGPTTTFYEFVGVTDSASQVEITKAIRKKSRQIHPDKVRQSIIASRAAQKQPGKAPGVHVNKPPSEREIQKAIKHATERYAKLGVVAEILKGPGRDRYDYFLKNGFPAWKGTGYYYTRYRPGLGTVLVGLFIFGGGAVHYGALVLSYKRQREFVERYIRQARRAAWGDDTGLGGIPGLGESTATSTPDMSESEPNAASMTRKQKRQVEKDIKKEKRVKKPAGFKQPERAAIAPPEQASGPVGRRREVEAENGKKLVVDSTGDVYLKEDDELFLLDIDEIEAPTFRNTALYRVPLWLYQKAVGRFLSRDAKSDENAGEGETEEDQTPVAEPINGSARKRNRADGKSS